MRQLALVQFLTWLGLFCMFLYFAVAVAHNVFGATSSSELAFTKGVIWAGYCSGIYNAVCFLVAPLLPGMVNKFGKRGTHSLCLFSGGLGLLAIALIHNKWVLFLPMVGIGIAWASILSMPYSILAAAIPSNKMGIYMGIFNFFIVIPEILSSLVFGWVMAHLLGNDRMKALLVGGICFLAAAILTQRIQELTLRDDSFAPFSVLFRSFAALKCCSSVGRVVDANCLMFGSDPFCASFLNSFTSFSWSFTISFI